ncbi:YtxH domain-containing protein [Pontibacter sp. KCTC 32443]|uniref:YtxH domain-containing protein n=1 Tax=Pontibacter TaxID=323449 RepID=UPI00164D713E|nr:MULTISPECIES: YtxH domain-containing protein [Pontibacter]MBC5775423.1 YtxH domain-containing protein [Pontibacter sp. KCTC 32443]
MDKNGKILLATLSGIGAGIVAGIMLAPDNGKTTRDSVKRSLTKAGEDMDKTMRTWMSKMKGTSTAAQDDELVMHGSWEDVKGQMRRNYDEITENIEGNTGDKGTV